MATPRPHPLAPSSGPAASRAVPPEAHRPAPHAPIRRRLRSLDRKSLTAVGRLTFREAMTDRISMTAASLAFHWFLAIFPAALALLALSSLIGVPASTLQRFASGVTGFLPATAASVITAALRAPVSRQTSLAAVALGSAVALWSWIEAMAALQIGLDIAYEVRGDRGFVRRRLMSLPLVALTILLGGSASALLVLGAPLQGLLTHVLPLATPVVALVWAVVHWVVAVGLIMLLVSGYYTLGPRREAVAWDWISPGSALATAVWVAAAELFSLYLNNFAHSARTYGAFAGVAVLLLWLFLTALVILLGAELNCALEQLHKGPEKDGSVTPLDPGAGNDAHR